MNSYGYSQEFREELRLSCNGQYVITRLTDCLPKMIEIDSLINVYPKNHLKEGKFRSVG